MKLKIYALIILLLLIGQSAQADQPSDDPIGDLLFAPELVMQHQQAIGLTDEQKESLKTDLRKAQVRFTELQWQLQDEMERLLALLKQEQIGEQPTITQLDKVLSIEREIKRGQFALLIQIRNRLTPEQRARLMEIKNKAK
jgi:Spy/CpxP family protein refolding chaperone